MINKTLFKIPKMDCLSEERIIRMKLDGSLEIKKMDFNIPMRELVIYHSNKPEDVLSKLKPLGFGAEIAESEISFDQITIDQIDYSEEFKVLKILLIINAGMFLVEVVAGFLADSMGLISDSFDMLADASVYGISLFAVGKTLALKKKSAKVNSTLQFIIGAGILIETARRFIIGSDPEPTYMIAVSLLALAANVYCLVLLSKHKNGEVHMKASYICSSSDVVANAGVILAGVLVSITNTQYPDLIIGIIISIVVLKGAISIFNISKEAA